ncbi:MAG: hypothetical protein JNM51_02725 [Bacteroidia bacterium]|nr:hypothetical protein [Bacteroidia bacterium]
MFDFNDQLTQIELNLDEAMGAYFVYDNIIQKAVADEMFLQKMNQNLYFWHSIIYSLQTTYFICMGRIFDNKSKVLSVNAFLNKCSENIQMFSKAELAKRKIDILKSDIEFQNYIDNAYEPTQEDFRFLKNIVKEYSKDYESNYRDIRHKVFGHTEVTKKEELERLFSNTSKIKLEEMFLVMKHIMIGLFGLYHNGHKIEFTSNILQYGFNLFTKIKEESNIVLQSMNAL